MQESLFNKVSRLQDIERLLHSCFPVIFTKYFKTLFCKTPLCDCFDWIPFFCSLRPAQPQKTFPSTLVILNIFEVNTVNCFRTALCGGPWQTVSQLYLSRFIANRAGYASETLLQIQSSLPSVFYKIFRNFTKTSKMESLFRKNLNPQGSNCTKKDTITSFFLWICSCEYIFSFLLFCFRKDKISHWRCPVRNGIHKKFHRKTPALSLCLSKLQAFKNTYFEKHLVNYCF